MRCSEHPESELEEEKQIYPVEKIRIVKEGTCGEDKT